MAVKTSYISYLRVIATVFVILIHSSTGFLYHFDIDSFDWNYANWINASTRCSVPIFVALSGALLLPKDEKVLEFYKKRLLKLAYPFIFWTLIYLIYYFYKYTNFSHLSSTRIYEIAVDKILHGANAHLWYLYMILGLYLAIPFLSKLIKQLSNREIEIFLLLWAASMLLTSKKLHDYTPNFDLTFFSGYLGYLVLGYYLHERSGIASKLTTAMGYIIVVIATAVGTILLSQKAHKMDFFFYNYVFINTALITTFLFVFVKQATQKLAAPKWLLIIDEYSFGIYLSHIIPLNYLHPMISKYCSTVWVIPLVTIATLLSSILITWLLRKIPMGKYVSG